MLTLDRKHLLFLDEKHVVPLTAPFAIVPMPDVLASRKSDGIAAAQALTPASFSDSDDPSGDILQAITPALPVIRSRVLTMNGPANCGLEYGLVGFRIAGPAEGLDWIPSSLSEEPPLKIGYRTDTICTVKTRSGVHRNDRTHVYVVFLDNVVTEQQIKDGDRLAVEYLTRHLESLQDECDGWREAVAPDIRAAVDSRRRQLSIQR